MDQRRHPQYQRGLTFYIQWLVAIGLIMALLAGLTINKNGQIDQAYQLLILLTPLVAFPVYSLFQVYNRHTGYVSGAWRVLLAWLTVLIILSFIGFFSKTSAVFSREVILKWVVLGGTVQLITFCSLHRLARLWSARSSYKITTAIIGTGTLADRLGKASFNSDFEKLVGLISCNGSSEPEIAQLAPVLGEIEQLRTLIQRHDIRKLYIALSMADAEKIEALYIDLLDMNVDVVWLPNLEGLVLLNHSISTIGGMPAIHLNESPLTTNRRLAVMKAIMDKVFALVAIAALSPVFAVTAVAVKRSSPGPIMFKQKRHGWNGDVIDVWKFRSMYLHDAEEVKQAYKDDARITGVGKFIRRWSIDELPQFFNVLMGSMSLVGPRPHAVEHGDYYRHKIEAYMARHRIKPGITGLAQISGCRGETETVDRMKARVEYDLSYINNWSLALDLKILLKTPITLLSKDIY